MLQHTPFLVFNGSILDNLHRRQPVMAKIHVQEETVTSAPKKKNAPKSDVENIKEEGAKGV